MTIEDGYVSSLKSQAGIEYVAAGVRSPLLSLRLRGNVIKPETMAWNPDKHLLTLAYASDKVKAEIKVLNKGSHLTFEIASVKPKKDIELGIWGPYATTISKSIGETVGVVHDDTYAIGIQALNPKTLGGYPNTEDDIEPSYDIFASASPVDLPEEDRKKDLFRGDTARQTAFGSVLQAYTRNRDKDRVIENWGHKHFVAPAFHDGGLIGSKIAIFACTADQALNTIGQIEVQEGLPHPQFDGVWAKQSRSATESFLIIGFGEKNLDEAIDLTQKAGLKFLYTDSCFDTWGHFKLNPERFPHGVVSMKRCVERAEKRGVSLGVHTLSNFITTNDPYVTPIPDKRLAVVGASKLSESITERSQSIQIQDPTFFIQMENNTLKTVRVNDELIQYGKVSLRSPWVLLDCKRGAFGTKPSAHSKGATIGKLLDHPYNVFLTNENLSQEVARNIADLFNRTGLKQLSFDGLEGNWSTGLGQYGRTLFTKTWFDHLSPELRGKVINDASNPGHYFWHIYTRMNWGEPWYAGFRESQTQYRLMNQRYFKRNLMPAMLGWFSMSAETSLEDAEWLLARAAGFDAGFCLVTGIETVHQNGAGNRILETVKQWEAARRANAFSENQKARLQVLANEFRLVPTGDDSWNLIPVLSTKARFTAKDSVTLKLENPYSPQPLQFTIQAPKEMRADHLKISIDNEPSILLAESIDKNAILRYAGGSKLEVLDGHWNPVKTIEVPGLDEKLAKGPHQIRFSAAGEDNKAPEIKIEARLFGPAEAVTSHRSTNF